MVATPVGSAILVEWETLHETNLLGFNIYRAEEEDGPQILLTPTLIPAQTPGGPFGNTYQFMDMSVEPGREYYYWIEMVYTSGSERVGPLVVESTFPLFLPLVVR
jgi:hypothetical protein